MKIGVFGIGHLGNYYLHKYSNPGNCEIVAVVYYPVPLHQQEVFCENV
jgi:hypothetical protein